MNKEGPDAFHDEGLVLPGNNTPDVDVNLGAALASLESNANDYSPIAALKSSNLFTEAAEFQLFNVFNHPNGKNQTIKYANMGFFF